ncbi:hypothetical protein CK218_12925 [Mesorhizobium sp. WSM3879]|uniref:hypothetical protein n=1 Tax=Mesorhizobium sp. WSM3879 TaxID=2029406 RepID=UPI000BAF36B8|nr:hypothetical protein [Mesorhizobium sp. WSM3879]PBB81261.1 hypothetical protein CK218_12925 [Mesorhizobium sp. WSM3879]
MRIFTKAKTYLKTLAALPTVLLIGCNSGGEVLGSEGNWTVLLTKSDEESYCQLESDVSGRKFGIRLFGDRSLVYSSNQTWNIEDNQAVGLAFFREANGFIIRAPGPIPVNATVLNHEIVAQLTPEMFELIAEPLLLDDQIDRVILQFPGSEGRWQFSTDEPRRLGEVVVGCLEQLKVINAGQNGAQPL